MDKLYYDGEFIRNRIKQLRDLRDDSDREISLSIGRNESYITHIVSGSHLPGMDCFLAICEYFNITPGEFFDPELKNPAELRGINIELQRLLRAEYTGFSKILKRLTEDDVKTIRDFCAVLKKIE